MTTRRHFIQAMAAAPAVVRLCHVTTADTEKPLERLHALVPAHAGAHGIATTTLVLTGDQVAAAVVEEARHMGADAIVMGVHGGGQSTHLMGRVAHAAGEARAGPRRV